MPPVCFVSVGFPQPMLLLLGKRLLTSDVMFLPERITCIVAVLLTLADTTPFSSVSNTRGALLTINSTASLPLVPSSPRSPLSPLSPRSPFSPSFSSTMVINPIASIVAIYSCFSHFYERGILFGHLTDKCASHCHVSVRHRYIRLCRSIHWACRAIPVRSHTV